MNKMLAKEHVEDVLGKELSDMHLSLVEESQKISYEKDLSVAFVWASTPQGHYFWNSVYLAITNTM